ncbi:HET-domain-containing protein, partial [Polychaeton citri CBS 116435]
MNTTSSQSVTDAAIYCPLSTSTPQLRLLKILPSQTQESDILCSLDVVDFQHSSTPYYQALSYVWGEQDPKFTITVNGHSFEVGRNLYTALCHVRHESMPQILWIDALCINQSDAVEKEHQIRQMGAIYTRAFDVLVWFGKLDDDIEIAMDLLSDMEKTVDLSRLDCKLFDTPWFGRIWVVQE